MPAGAVSQVDLETFQAALACFQSGDWSRTRNELASLSAGDSAKQFMTSYIDKHQGLPPEDWDGVVRMEAK